MIERKEGEWVVYYDDDDGEREIARVQFPPNVTQDEKERFAAHLMKLAKEREHGSN